MAAPIEPIELSIVMPCLNEAETLATCIGKAQGYLERSGVVGEVVIADNGSTDGSQDIARELGARVVDVEAKGYGNALMGGIRAAHGTYVIMGDADDSYDFANLDPFVAALRDGAELVMGNRFKGGIEPGAMPPLHKYLGNPVLSFIGKLFFKAPVGDFHCGLRGFRREAILRIGLHTSGMEFASEIVVKSCLSGLRIAEVPTTLKKDGRSRPPHLRSWRDGWRHLRFLLIYSPRWLFLYPGLAGLVLGLAATLALLVGPIAIGGVGFDVATMLYTAGIAVVGYQAVLFSVMVKLFAAREGLLPMSARYRQLIERFSIERGLILGLLIFVAGVVVALLQLLRWGDTGFGALDTARNIRTAIPAVLGLVLGFQTIMFSMFVGVLSIPTTDGRTLEDAVKAKPEDTDQLIN
ncbi:glycosyltransferase family 2 protein [Actinocrispum wychmicini]|uniref:Glycosyltransferase involved in cell wall biosynthesis n=1 Tax=Actinocrispum wychmicini TaxID=1213861 RepID=A0A4R2JKE6_9PSEU|nr:glycosyltransferase family 2 protein [Actinocrispum wychmicini]TCO60471.1 glycosyltransferase involved in cell wall biosynthesis [Actinocrispum wychmicini]